MIILIGSQKGGCGKSTTAVNICAELASLGHDVVLVDADRQCTAANCSGLHLKPLRPAFNAI
jgi:chromosome partitioning protein